ncbi:hypothetical protein [Cryptosporangium sp. NPDC048952]|uniref:hypothetical protein n=1 Tax=Cryptosporangium sp. NPDC048952 TaxID=3363961 RepID=UPI003723729A
MAPTPDEVRVALAAMRGDASTWDEMSDALAGAARVVDRLDLSSVQFSYVGDLVGLPEVYGEIQRRIAALLRQGSDEFDALGAALRQAADGYEEDDRSSAHQMRNIY